ncbi:hypothetical protein [Corynebacterium auris]|uniref:hypothetical protein n=1 Tax=Corynebacterium auris TaxID=44750 RepID=UPI0025B3E554|nr:hypothetical protein [Corynebacterium auris]WJY69084.1 hypothetical protein CAURIS_11080 [Corynebacterium auris]
MSNRDYGDFEYPTSDNYGSGDYYEAENYGPGAFDVNAAHGALHLHGTRLVDGAYGDGQQLHPVNDPQANGWVHRRGTGKMNPFAAWGFGFKATFANWKLWITVGALFFLGIFVLSIFAPLLANLLSVAMLFLYPALFSLALLNTLVKDWKFDGLRSPNYGPALGMVFVLLVVSVLFSFLFTFLGSLIFGGEFVDRLAAIDPADIEAANVDALLGVLGAMGKILAVVGLGMFLISPFFLFPMLYAADNAADFGTCIKEGVAAGGRNYGWGLLFVLIALVLAVVGSLLLGLGLIVVLPATFLAQTYAYRQVSGGPVPADA